MLRAGTRGVQRWLRLGVAVLAPLVAAPYFGHCGSSGVPRHGISPSRCDPYPSQTTCANGKTPIADAEDRMTEAQASQVLYLGDTTWERLEVCEVDAAGQEICEGIHPTQCPGTCQCTCDFNPVAVSDVDLLLTSYISHTTTSDPSLTGGRAGLIQLSPIFTFQRTVPPYLFDDSFDSPEMFVAFARLWDRIASILEQDKFSLQSEGGGRASWVISIGNEIDAYLSSPLAVDGGSAVAAWAAYRTFYLRAADYVMGRTVTVGAQTYRSPHDSFPRTVGFTTRWGFERGRTIDEALFDEGLTGTATDEICGPGSLSVLHNERSQGCTVYNLLAPAGSREKFLSGLTLDLINSAFTQMQAKSHFWIYTTYPHFFGEPSGTGTADFYAEMLDQFQEMAAVSEQDWPQSAVPPRPIIIQEIGYPSSRFVAPGQSPPNHNNELIADQQLAMVNAAFDAMRDHNDLTPLDQGILSRIQGINWFSLHDLSQNGACLPGVTPLPTCAWGLINEQGGSGAEKIGWLGTGATPGFLARAQALNPDSIDPQR